jgi:hypothetical protein
MDDTFNEVLAIFSESRNGANDFFRHALAPKLTYTDGVRDVAEAAGAYWLLDVIGTEFTPVMLKQFETGYGIASIHLLVGQDNSAIIVMSAGGEKIYERTLEYTSFPVGSWEFLLGVDNDLVGYRTTLILPTEY